MKICYPIDMPGFQQTGFIKHKVLDDNNDVCSQERIILSKVTTQKKGKVCPCCNSQLHMNGYRTTDIKHLPLGEQLTILRITRARYRCSNPKCSYSVTADIPKQAEEHLFTQALQNCIEDLFLAGCTISDVEKITHVNRRVIRRIDISHIQRTYTMLGKDGTRYYAQPEQTKYLGIDEFVLQRKCQYTTIIMDLETGHVLWKQHGRTKQVVSDFMEHVGQDWMAKVEAVASQKNSDVIAIFKTKYPHIKAIVVHFYIEKKLNDNEKSRKDEIKRLSEEVPLEETATKIVKKRLQSSEEK